MSGPTTLLDLLADGEALKARGLAVADEAADDDWKAATDAAIERLAASGQRFTAETVRRIAGDPPGHPNAMGSRFQTAARAGLIVKVGYREADRPTLHRHPIAVWQGAAS